MSVRCDYLGRRYIEVPAFPADSLEDPFAKSPFACQDCGTALVYGAVRYFQRNTSTLAAINFESVCCPCGDRALARGMLFVQDEIRVRTALMEIERKRAKLQIVSEKASALRGLSHFFRGGSQARP